MIPYERKNRILELLRTQDVVMFDELMEHIPGVSESTLRRDIRDLEANRLLERLSGGAIKSYRTATELPMSAKVTLNADAKEAICRRAAEEVRDGETVYVDSGSTCSGLLPLLLDRPVTIVTTNTDIFAMAIPGEGAQVIMLGGALNASLSSLAGPLTEDALSHFVFDRAFLGANGVSVTFGITTPSLAESSKKRAVAARSKATYVLCDASKFHQSASAHALDLSQAILITNEPDERLEEKMTVLVAS